MADFLGNPKTQYFESGTAEFLAGGKLYSYQAGTLIPAPTYPTIDDANTASNPNTNPVILDSRGEADVVIAGSTKLILKDADDNTIWTADDVGASSSSGDIVDTAGNTLLGFVSVANAVNYWEITNAATGSTPILASKGADLNVPGSVTSKGASTLSLDGGDSGTVDINAASTGDVNIGSNTDITGTLTASGTVTASAALSVVGNTDFLPTGTFTWFCGAGEPTGWLQCNGQAVSRTTYAALFAVISTTFGSGDGSTTFNVPNVDRRTIMGVGGTGTGTIGNTIGSTGGAETHTLIEAEMPAHTHSTSQSGFVGGGASGVVAGSSTLATPDTDSTGGDGAHNNIQPSIVMSGLIRHL